MALFKTIAARLPERSHTEMKRIYFARKIKKDTFITDEPEFEILHKFINPGDWVMDIGANVGHYTKRFSDLVRESGRVIAFEPIPVTFSILSANVQLFTQQNVTLINAAVSDKLDVAGMSWPKFSTGLTNYYEAHISSTKDKALSVLTLSLDSLIIDKHVSLVKIDAEGHESYVLSGMQNLIEKYFPVLIIETESTEVIDKLKSLGYAAERLKNSPNILFNKNR